MKKTSVLSAAAALALTSSVALAAGPGASNIGHASTARVFPSQSVEAVLYDQNDNDSGIGITSQNFEASLDLYDNQGADDFKVPTGFIWKVTEVDVTGVYYNGPGPAPSVHVTIYKNKGGLPGSKVVADYPAIVPADNGFGSFQITLPTGAKLQAGRYWVSVQANLEFAVGGQWGWEGRTVQSGQMAAWRNPGDGFGTGCSTWNYESTCIPSGQGPDKMFTIKGRAKPV
jgi:hypothetical protein